MKANLHLSMTNVKNASRLFKQTRSLLNQGVFDKIYVVGLGEKDLSENEVLSDGQILWRINLFSRKLGANIIAQGFKYIEYVWRILFKYRKHGIKVVTSHGLDTLLLGVLMKYFYGIKLVYDAHEYETEKQGLTGFRKKVSKIAEKTLIKHCDWVCVVSPSIAMEYKKLYPNLNKPTVILNTPPFQEVEKQNLFRQELGIGLDKTIFLYQGGFSKGRGIESILDAFSEIEDKNNVIVFMGYGYLESKIKRYSHKHKNIFYLPAVHPSKLLGYTSSSDFGIILYENNCLNHYYCSPNKIFEYLMAGVVIIASNLFELKNIVEGNDVGIITKENSSQGLIDAINKSRSLNLNQIRNNISTAIQTFNWEQQEIKLLPGYNKLFND